MDCGGREGEEWEERVDSWVGAGHHLAGDPTTDRPYRQLSTAAESRPQSNTAINSASRSS